MRMGDSRPRSFKELSGLNWREEDSYYVLGLITKKGLTILYGVPDLAIRRQIDAHLRIQGLRELPAKEA